jgi:hypothetical protein
MAQGEPEGRIGWFATRFLEFEGGLAPQNFWEFFRNFQTAAPRIAKRSACGVRGLVAFVGDPPRYPSDLFQNLGAVIKKYRKS